MSEPPRKRRAVRKGTRNCWECKRRKVRCIFTTPSSAACENCLHRNTTCISQEFEKETESNPELPITGLEARLVRVEHLLQQVVDRTETTALVEVNRHHEEHMPACMADIDDRIHFTHANDLLTPSITPPSASIVSTTASTLNSINHSLLALWPNVYDLDYLYELPPYLSAHLHLGTSPASGTPRQPAPVRAMLKLPKPTSHPVLIARNLLLLAGLLQRALSLPDADIQRRKRFKQLMLTIPDTVSKSVTANEEMISSIEGLQCIMLEALIQNHTGKLHQAWRTLRRATSMAQTLGLHRDTPLRIELFLDPDNFDAFDAEYFCFQIVYTDRYLSMTLGLPHVSYLPFAMTSEQLMAFSPVDRMARMQCMVAERLLARRRDDPNELRDIDSMLSKAAAQMPHHWWLVPEPDTIRNVQQDHSGTHARFTFQLCHNHLLLRLYMPCILQPLYEAEHAHGRRIVWSASRKILSCYLAFRKWDDSIYYCRGIDFLALIAVTVLCVSHIDSRRVGATSLTELAHDYATDRAMMQQILGVMQWSELDVLASQLAKMMQSLLDIEADAANGTEYSATAVDSSEVATEYQSELLDEGRKLRLRIPYFGTILLQRLPGLSMDGATSEVDGVVLTAQDSFESSLDYNVDWSQQAAAYEDWTLQNVNQALFLDLFGSV